MLPRNQQMELMSKIYVQAVVAQAGGSCLEPPLDFGIDYTIHRIDRENGEYSDQGAAIHLQLKSTSEPRFHPDVDAFHHDLEV